MNTLVRKQSGIALITTLLLLMLMSAMVVGFVLLVTEGQRLSGLNNDQSRAFYGAEAGMEKLTADLGTLFGNTYAPTGPQVDAIALLPPSLPSSAPVKFLDALGASSYTITYPKDSNLNPKAGFAQITAGSSPFQGMTALETPYTLTVGARTTNGAEVKLRRTLQTVGIPLFQFGIFSETDLSYFPGPNFNFGGRVHTNGNLFLNSGGPAGALPTQPTAGPPNQLWLANPVTVHGQILRDCLSNGHTENAGGTHPGSVEITKGGGAFQALGFGQGSWLGCLTGGAANGSWSSISASFNGNLRSGVNTLNLTITLLGNGAAQPIDIIRRPVQNEDVSNPGILGERYFSQASLRILLSDNANDITRLPCVSPGAPFNLADIARPVAAWATPNAVALQTAMVAAGTPRLPLAASGAAGGINAALGSYTPADGYWQATNTPIITGFIKIEIQRPYGNPCGTMIDVTREVLSLGYAGKNVNPVPQSFDGQKPNLMWAGTTFAGGVYTNANMALGAAPNLPLLPTALAPILPVGTATSLSPQNGGPMGAGNFTGPSLAPAFAGYSTGSCLDPHPNAVIRLERIRDNPSSVPVKAGLYVKPGAGQNLPLQSTVAQVCGVDPATLTLLAGWTPAPSDFWPNVFFDTREGTRRDFVPAAPFNQEVTLGGAMNYVELDVRNLARWFSGTIGASGPNAADPAVAPNNFVVYISDRRGNYAPAGSVTGARPPLSPTGNETGEYGFSDFVNPLNLNGCPNGTLDTGEDLNQLGSPAGFFTYGQVSFPPGLVDSTGVVTANTLFQGAVSSLTATAADPNCASPNPGLLPWPGTFVKNAVEARQNPPAFFRRALKLVNGSLITLTPLCPGNVTCGLTIATENPAYVQGDYNSNSANNGFNDPVVAASIATDALTLLSNSWNDANSFAAPFNTTPAAAPLTSGRRGTTTWYRMGVVAGKGQSFPIPGWNTTALNGSQDFATDGGVHNFMRYIEDWNGTLNYQGSIISMYYNHQATGLYKCCNTVYRPPSRGYQFDTNFLNPVLLPPRTPMFRDINTTGFTQLLLPTQ